MIIVDVIISGIIAFASTNLDDLIVLMSLYSMRNSTFKTHHIVIGQYLGIGLLTCVSIIAAFGLLLFPEHWIGLLGLIPIFIGVHMFMNNFRNAKSSVVEGEKTVLKLHLRNSFFNNTFLVASITIANGGDNIGIYIPFFALYSLSQIFVIVVIFSILIAVWCYIGFRLATLPMIKKAVEKYGGIVIPFVFIGIGIHVIVSSGTWEHFLSRL
ncbi:cadmium resistance transporter [Ornithinibacillus sp. FSL M8-0202]|uniref:cadmium resistance transporter n=1 Tax=Ornithinibacillus sp. FSL M8-0202 TaxID=2921616 RepID=UPI0030D1BA5D